ncbi:MAG: hypothetical protein H0U05_01070 [Actinobacteria bacterium]|nr:hypothetical protein [Actinomycetota bacterium]
MKIRRTTITPGTAIALLALFFALGGSAFAVGERVQRASVAQQRCSNGAVRGIAYVTGNPAMGIANIGGTFTSAGVVFGRKFNCNGKAIQVRRVSLGVFEIRFVGNPASSAVASGVGNAYAVVDPLPGGLFRVAVHPAGRDDPADQPFVFVLV